MNGMNVGQQEAAKAEISKLQEIVHQYTTFFIIFDIIFFVAIVFIIIFAIQYLKSKKQLKSSNRYIRFTIKGQEEERARIARELHDTIAQDLRYCRNLSEKIEDKNDPELSKKLSYMLEKSLSSVRNMSYNLAPPDVIKNDLSANVLNLAQNFREHSDVEFRLTIPDLLDSEFLTEEQNLNLYRIIQEALTNVIKHARASEVTLLVRNENGDEAKGIYIFISDDGVGFEPSKINERGTDGNHFGFVGMNERADFIGAKLLVDSHPGEGTQITVIKEDQTELVKKS